jgi:alpha-L-rhamnosidase
MLPWYLYLHSGDIDVIQRHWEGMQHLMAHCQRSAPEWILSGGYGDFFDPGTDAIVQHTPQALSSTLWFFRCAKVMSRMAAALGDMESTAAYSEWQRDIAGALRGRFFDAASGSFGSQGANALALAFEVLPEENERILAALVADIRARDNHMNVGVMGVRFIFEALTRNGEGELALALFHKDTYPSFGHLIQRGATTLWECWGEAGHDEKHGARSLNHPFMGGFDNFFFNTLAGIRPDPENPGFKHFFLEPHPIAGVEWVRCHHDTAYGRIESNWHIGNNEFIWSISVPPGTEATATIPYGGGAQTLSTGIHEIRRKM